MFGHVAECSHWACGETRPILPDHGAGELLPWSGLAQGQKNKPDELEDAGYQLDDDRGEEGPKRIKDDDIVNLKKHGSHRQQTYSIEKEPRGAGHP